jgi:prefoldin beta subunit
MAAEIDKEVAYFREIQEQLQKVRGDSQTVMGQQTENEMVQHELELLDGSSSVYKMVGPVLIKNSLGDAKETVGKRIEFITAERKRLETKAQELETQGNEISAKVQQMQGLLQQATAAAVQEVAKQSAVV